MSADENPQSLRASSLCWPRPGGGRCTAPGVTEKRGAGAGCTTPSRVRKVSRAALWGVGGGLVHVEHGGGAGVGAGQGLGPLVAGARVEDGGEALAQGRPRGGVHVALRLLHVGDAQALAELGEELRLQRADGHPAAAPAAVGVVEGGAAVEEVGAALVAPPAAGGLEAVEHGHQRGRAVDHGAVHHLPLAGLAGVQHRRDQAEGEVQSAAAEVGRQVQGRHGLVLQPDGVERACERQVVDVVPRRLGVGAGLPPAGHAAEDELGIAGQHRLGAEPQPLHHAGAEAFDQGVRAFQQAQAGLDGLRRLQVERHGTATAAGHVSGCGRIAAAALGEAAPAVDADHVSAEVAEQHAGEGRGADAGELHHLQARERSLARSLRHPAQRSLMADLMPTRGSVVASGGDASQAKVGGDYRCAVASCDQRPR